jgi:hypothetical protein
VSKSTAAAISPASWGDEPCRHRHTGIDIRRAFRSERQGEKREEKNGD